MNPTNRNPKRGKTSSGSYVDKLNKLHEMRAKAGGMLHSRVKLANEIYNDPEYREKMGRDFGKTPDAVSPDELAIAIDNTWPDLIALAFSWTGSRTDAEGNQCGALQTIYEKFPNREDWVKNHLPALWKKCEVKREKAIATRNRASLKDLENRDKKIANLNCVIERLKEEKSKLEAQIQKLEVQITKLRAENAALRQQLMQLQEPLVA